MDVAQIHENLLASNDKQIINIADTLQDFAACPPSIIIAVAKTMMAQTKEIQKCIENAVSQTQLHRLSTLTFPHEVLLAIKSHINTFAQEKSYVSFVSHISDLFQNEALFVFQPNNNTFIIL